MKKNYLSFFPVMIFVVMLLGCEKEKKIKIVGEVTADMVSPTEFLITWETNYPGYSKVYYGLTDDLELIVVDEEEREYHSVRLTNLKGDTTYYYKVKSKSSLLDSKVTSSLLDFITGENAESITQTGWEFFAQAEYDSALEYFNNAILIDDDYGWTYIGFGWVYLKQGELEQALSNFNVGLGLKESMLDGRFGRASVNLVLAEHNEVISDCNYILEKDSVYSFAYDDSLDYKDVRILLAQAYFATGQYELAQDQCDILDPNNILDPAMPNTWFVSNIFYVTYVQALLALINIL